MLFWLQLYFSFSLITNKILFHNLERIWPFQFYDELKYFLTHNHKGTQKIPAFPGRLLVLLLSSSKEKKTFFTQIQLFNSFEKNKESGSQLFFFHEKKLHKFYVGKRRTLLNIIAYVKIRFIGIYS